MTANELFLRHAAKHLRQYRGNLRWFCEAFDKGLVPPTDDETIRPYVERLKRPMRLSAVTEEDEYLLRFGLIVPGVMRGISPPVSVLEPERGGFSDKRLEQAAGQVMRLQTALRTAQRYFGELSPSPVEALRKLTEKLASVTCDDHDWVDLHAALPEAESTELAKRALSCLDEPEESAELGVDILTCLANFRREGLGAQTQELVNREIFWPASLYRDAPEDVAKRLAQQIERTRHSDRVRLNHLLLALAWTRGEFACSAFLKWRRSPPAWAEVLHVPPEGYLHDAGWALDCDGNRRELLSLSCHAISPCEGNSLPQFVVPCRTETGTLCPACGGSLVWLFDFANLPAEYFDGDRAQAPRAGAVLS